MKKFIIATLLASVVASPVLAAPRDNHHGNQPRYEQGRNDRGGYDRHDRGHNQVQYRKWGKGQRFDSRYARNYRVISAPSAYHLRPAPRGYRWVQSGNDAVMVGITTGIVAAIIASAIN